MTLDEVMIAITTLGSPQSVTFLCLILAVFLLMHKKPHHFFQFTIFMSLGALSVWGLKNLFQIPRPVGGVILESGYGFPSGHSVMATLFCSLLVYSYISHFKSQIGKFLLVLVGASAAGLIVYSRIYLGVHSIVDVAGGITLGAFWFILSVIFFTYIERNQAE